MTENPNIQTTHERKERIKRFSKKQDIAIKHIVNMMIDHCMPQLESGELTLTAPQIKAANEEVEA